MRLFPSVALKSLFPLVPFFVLICKGMEHCGGPFENGLLLRSCWKTLNRNSLDCFCDFTVPVIWSRKSLPNYSFPEFSNSALLSFIIDFAWLDLFMTPASELSRLWYDMVLLVCPARSTICWTKFSKSSMIKSTSSSGAVVALSRPCHTFDRGPMTSIFFFLIFSSVLSKVQTDVWCLSEDRTKIRPVFLLL